jgi:N-acetylneuraminate synthase
MLISYAKGARTWERHVDIEYNDVPVSNYCSLPNQVDEWFKAFHKAAEMTGNSSESRRVIPKEEISYLNALVRGVYAKRDLPAGYKVEHHSFSTDFQLAVRLMKGQLSSRELLNGLPLLKSLSKGDPVTIDHVGGPYNENQDLRKLIQERGL